ncbi:unnamed protein product [Didymodactylos carnosus]|uniref:Uncharacterized protein n=1 Tax=Didymodactylos carnosus TaxID=1234261 RepID=A0A8S2RBT7_9BILA|nr:unnamed protein product [Didymodactylos carnosus]CAF4153852.1 unnamed protein product [Didymodactylos carnosus]
MAIDDDKHYFPLLNDPDSITPEFIYKLKRATENVISVTDSASKKQEKILSANNLPTQDLQQRQTKVKSYRRRLKAMAIAARFNSGTIKKQTNKGT